MSFVVMLCLWLRLRCLRLVEFLMRCRLFRRGIRRLMTWRWWFVLRVWVMTLLFVSVRL